MEKDNISIIQYESRFENEIIRLANAAFGENYLTAEKLASFLRRIHSFYIAVEGDSLLGYCLFLIEPTDDAAQGLKLDAARLQVMGGQKPVCHTKSMSVIPERRKTGLAKTLFNRCLQEAVGKGAGSAWGMAWKVGEKVPMDSIFRDAGFSVHSELPMAWFDDKDYRCVVCDGPCRCTGVVYYKIFEERE